MPIPSNLCESCGVCLQSNRTSIAEIVSGLVCGSLLLAVLTLAGYAASQWLDRQEQRFLDYPIWNEPLDSWRP
jgi:hypothetical protein